MCLIVNLPTSNKKAHITENDMRASLKRNGDGMGVMYPVRQEDNTYRVEVHYCLGTADEQVAFYKKHRALAKKGFACHMRMSTDGVDGTHNCHPHVITTREKGHRKNLYLMHNGILRGYTTGKDAVDSDTIKFIKEVMAPQLSKYPNLIKDDSWRMLVEDHIGIGNKLLVMDDSGKTWTFNRKQGVERNGAWLSNSYSITGANYYDNKPKYPANNNRYNGNGWGGANNNVGKHTKKGKRGNVIVLPDKTHSTAPIGTAGQKKTGTGMIRSGAAINEIQKTYRCVMNGIDCFAHEYADGGVLYVNEKTFLTVKEVESVATRKARYQGEIRQAAQDFYTTKGDAQTRRELFLRYRALKERHPSWSVDCIYANFCLEFSAEGIERGSAVIGLDPASVGNHNSALIGEREATAQYQALLLAEIPNMEESEIVDHIIDDPEEIGIIFSEHYALESRWAEEFKHICHQNPVRAASLIKSMST